jgi:hypothetical protein
VVDGPRKSLRQGWSMDPKKFASPGSLIEDPKKLASLGPSKSSLRQPCITDKKTFFLNLLLQ